VTAKAQAQTREEAADTIGKLTEQLELKVNIADVDELIESHGAELLNENLTELETIESTRAD
jgi:hypothetical protein